MTRGSSHEIEPSGQMSVEVCCMLIFSAQILCTFLLPRFGKTEKRSFFEESEMAEENKAPGNPL